MNNDVFNDYGDWLKNDLGIKRADSYKSNLRTIDSQLISRGGGSYLQSVYDDVMNGKMVNITAIRKKLKDITDAEENQGFPNVSIAEGTFKDCKSALNKFIDFLLVQMKKVAKAPMKGTGLKDTDNVKWQAEDVRNVINMEENDITYAFISTWGTDAKKTLNAKGRIVSQDRLNMNKNVCFPHQDHLYHSQQCRRLGRYTGAARRSSGTEIEGCYGQLGEKEC